MPHQVDDVHLDVELAKPARRFESEQAAADDRRARRAPGVVAYCRAVIERAKDEDPITVASAVVPQAVERRDKCGAARRDDQRVVGFDPAVGADDLPLGAIDSRGADAGVQLDAGVLGTTPAG